jgi:hypothetical protein
MYLAESRAAVSTLATMMYRFKELLKKMGF